MKTLRVVLVVAALSLPVPALAGELSLSFKDGRVTLKAVDTPLRQVLTEWARIGKTRIIGMEKLVGAPMTLELVDVPEKQALEILLRSVAGYMAAPRAASAASLSAFDRLALLPTSVAAPAPPARPNAFARPTAPAPFPDPIQLANEEPDAANAPAPPGVPVFNPNGDPATQAPVMRPPLPGEGQAIVPPTPTTAPATNPGPLIVSRPGVIPVPEPAPQPPRP